MIPELPVFVGCALLVIGALLLLHRDRHPIDEDERPTLNTRGDDDR